MKTVADFFLTAPKSPIAPRLKKHLAACTKLGNWTRTELLNLTNAITENKDNGNTVYIMIGVLWSLAMTKKDKLLEIINVARHLFDDFDGELDDSECVVSRLNLYQTVVNIFRGDDRAWLVRRLLKDVLSKPTSLILLLLSNYKHLKDSGIIFVTEKTKNFVKQLKTNAFLHPAVKMTFSTLIGDETNTFIYFFNDDTVMAIVGPELIKMVFQSVVSNGEIKRQSNKLKFTIPTIDRVFKFEIPMMSILNDNFRILLENLFLIIKGTTIDETVTGRESQKVKARTKSMKSDEENNFTKPWDETSSGILPAVRLMTRQAKNLSLKEKKEIILENKNAGQDDDVQMFKPPNKPVELVKPDFQDSELDSSLHLRSGHCEQSPIRVVETQVGDEQICNVICNNDETINKAIEAYQRYSNHDNPVTVRVFPSTEAVKNEIAEYNAKIEQMQKLLNNIK